jgi:hypothetical protein
MDTEEEETKLTEAVKTHGNHWVAVATLVPGRKNNQSCCERWTQHFDPANEKKGRPRLTWKPEDDTKLAEAVKNQGKHLVGIAARSFPVNRTNFVVDDGTTFWIQTAPRTQLRKNTTTAMTKHLSGYRYG